MFTIIRQKVARILAVASLALIASGLPLVQIAQATECVGTATCGGGG